MFHVYGIYNIHYAAHVLYAIWPALKLGPWTRPRLRVVYFNQHSFDAVHESILSSPFLITLHRILGFISKKKKRERETTTTRADFKYRAKHLFHAVVSMRLMKSADMHYDFGLHMG